MSDFFSLLSSQIDPGIIRTIYLFLITFSPVILVIILFIIFWPLWINYVRSEAIFKKKTVLLEIKLPKETIKSPMAMELFFTSLSQWGGEGTALDRVWSGGTRPWFSLEMVSVEGQVRFYIWTRVDQKNFTQSSLYAQFPGIEVSEVDDYAKSVHFDPKETKIWVATMKLLKSDAYPIKTYIDYGLDKDPKEEYKVDPLAPLIEYLGSVGYNQQVWIQILVRAHRVKQKGLLFSFSKEDEWKDKAKKEVNEILMRNKDTKVAGVKDEATGFTKLPSISKGEQDIVEALERSITKLPFDVGIRVMYIAKKEFFDSSNKGGIIGSFKQFNSEYLNMIIPDKDKHHQKFNYPWQDYNNFRYNRIAKLGLEAYKRRAYFYEPYVEKHFVLNSEELATIFHFPGQVAAAPTLYRVPSKKGQAPSNLPI